MIAKGKKCVKFWLFIIHGQTQQMAEKVAKETNANLANRDTIQPYIGSFQDVVDQGYMPPMPPERFML